jgi:hypothetical protein
VTYKSGFVPDSAKLSGRGGLIAMVYERDSKIIPVVERVVDGSGRFEIPTRRNVRLPEATGLAGGCCSPGETEVRRRMSEMRGG